MTPSKSWYVAYVHSCRERKAAQELSRQGIECYLPVQKEIHKWSDRCKLVERLVLPRMIFIHCCPSQRVPLLKLAPSITRYMSSGGLYNPVVVPDYQMDTFQKMVSCSAERVKVFSWELGPGDRVKVVCGPLSGLECELISISGKRCIGVRLGGVGTATMDLPLEYLEPIENNK